MTVQRNFPCSDIFDNQPKRHPGNKELRLWYEPVYRGVFINTKNGPMVVEYLESLISTYQRHAAEYPSKRLIVRVDLYFPSHWSDEQRLHTNYFTRFVSALKARLTAFNQQRGYQRSNTVRFCRAVEYGADGRGIHIHAVLFFNGSVFRALGAPDSVNVNLAHRINESWASALGLMPAETLYHGLIHWPDGCEFFIDSNLQGYTDVAKAFFTRSAYLCKAFSKRFDLPVKAFSCSRS
ncbi:MAG: inovirus-type Gp2 protein [Hydrogenovibrio sp.]|uniref:YagK/YfjJ domain-containing protein n=1 Tax=Hydrogenovibrio sp. TaxID=2065821 RepID=UPI0028703834|nr:inovirus-type Gp2 protein [Hydrogenovibrio sp.]MDR9498892.1 inovirus-type Gp2 protein [Hydrogenovibrio sp.]